MACTRPGQFGNSGQVTITPSRRLTELLGDWRGAGPGHERLAATVRALVLDGRIPLQSRLPAERTLASSLGLSRATVTAAYNRLREDGYISSRQGAGSWVTLPEGHRASLDAIVGGGRLDLRIAALPAPAPLQELYREATRELPRWLDHHGYDPLGLPPLRRAIARRFTERGLPTHPEQILVTNGALQALDLTLRAVLRRGQRALVEIPSYPAALDALRAAGARLDAIPVTQDGWDTQALDAFVRRDQFQLALLIPDFHNPTGALMNAQLRRRVLRALERAGVYTVLDETFVELNLDGVSMPAPAAADGGKRTITIGSLSKAIWGGLRVGWARADPIIVHRLATARASVDMASPVFEQIVATHALDRLGEIMRERLETTRVRRAALTGALDRLLPAWSYARPAGGMFLWTKLPRPVSTRLSIRAGERGVQITPGPRFAAAGLLEHYLRLPFALAPDQLEAAVAILAELSPGETAGAAASAPAFVA
jgi:DNA-binding transcriptional MocR family regulator